MLNWLVEEKGIAPHIPVFDKSKRDDGTFSRSDLPVAMEPDRRHSVKARAVRAPGFAGLRPRPDDAGPAGACHAGKGDVPRRPQTFLRRNSMTRISDSCSGIPGCHHSMA
jgi:hypothetical protein